MQAGLISIVIPCYNQGHFLEQTLQSVLDQTYASWECLIVNDGSTDNTSEIAGKWQQRDNRFRLIQKENGGRSSARNFGLDNAQGEFIQLLDADDLLLPTKFGKSIGAFENPNCDVVLTNFLRFRKTPEKTRRAFCDLQKQTYSFESILLGWDVHFSIPIHCGIFRQQTIKGIRFNTLLNAYEDWFFWLEVYKKAKETTFIDENLAYYRMNPAGTTINFEHMQGNLKKAYLLIYDTLDDKHKSLFFERMVSELIHGKEEFKAFKDSIFYRKLFYTLKSGLKLR